MNMLVDGFSSLSPYISILGVFIAILGFTYLWHSKRIIITAKSSLREIDGRPVALFNVVNKSERPITIRSIRLPLLIIDDTPRLQIHGFMKVMRCSDYLVGYESASCYASDKAIKYKTSDNKKTLGPTADLEAELDLDLMFKHFITNNEISGLRLYFLILSTRMKFEIVLTTGEIRKFRLHRDVNYLLKTKYGSDKRFFGD